MGKPSRAELAELMELLTPKQLHLFSLCFLTTDPKEVKPYDLFDAVRLCQATVEDNKNNPLDVIAQRHIK